MATTTNYGWTTPDDTALVKDGASAIRTLGSSVDTTTKALNPSTTLGDIEYRSSTANTNTRLGIGSSGQVLTVSGGLPTWATAASGALTQLYTSSMAGLATITTSTLSTSYKQLVIQVSAAQAPSGNLYMRFNANTSSNYAYVNPSADGFNTVPGVTNATFLFLGQPQASDKDMYSYTTIYNYTTGDQLKIGMSTGRSNAAPYSSRASYTGQVELATTSAITSVTIYSSTSTNWTAGTFTVWGLN